MSTKGDPRQPWYAAWKDKGMVGTYMDQAMFREGFHAAAPHADPWACESAPEAPAASTPPEGKVREALADHEHHRWSKWMAYLFSKCVQHPDGSKTIPAEWAHRWMLQTMTPYRDLTEREKDSDRAEVDEAEAVRSQALAAPAPALTPAQVEKREERKAGREAREARAKEATAPACKTCGGKRTIQGYLQRKPCPDCNADEGEKI